MKSLAFLKSFLLFSFYVLESQYYILISLFRRRNPGLGTIWEPKILCLLKTFASFETDFFTIQPIDTTDKI